MNPGVLKGLGITLGLVVVLLSVIHFISTFKSDNTNWYLLVMACGMVLLLFYTIRSGKRIR
ncbi:MAG: hypothetical protein JXQ90_19520 [Cyclobacteriaceae bacterium]